MRGRFTFQIVEIWNDRTLTDLLAHGLLALDGFPGDFLAGLFYLPGFLAGGFPMVCFYLFFFLFLFLFHIGGFFHSDILFVLCTRFFFAIRGFAVIFCIRVFVLGTRLLSPNGPGQDGHGRKDGDSRHQGQQPAAAKDGRFSHKSGSFRFSGPPGNMGRTQGA